MVHGTGKDRTDTTLTASENIRFCFVFINVIVFIVKQLSHAYMRVCFSYIRVCVMYIFVYQKNISYQYKSLCLEESTDFFNAT